MHSSCSEIIHRLISVTVATMSGSIDGVLDALQQCVGNEDAGAKVAALKDLIVRSYALDGWRSEK